MGTTALMIGMLGMQAASAGMQVAGGVQAAKYARESARATEGIGEIEADRIRREGRKLMGRQRAAYARAGVAIGTGTPLQVLMDTAETIELDALRAKYGADVEAQRTRTEGRIVRSQSIMGALGTGGQMLGSYLQYKQ